MKFILQSSDWEEAVKLWGGDLSNREHWEFIAKDVRKKAEEHMWGDNYIEPGDNSCEFSGFVKTFSGHNKLVGFINYYAIPEREDLECLMDNEDWTGLKCAAELLSTCEEMEQDNVELEREILDVIEELAPEEEPDKE